MATSSHLASETLWITGTGVAGATATVAALGAGMRCYVRCVGLQILAGTATLASVELRDSATARLGWTFPTTGGVVEFSKPIPITSPNTAFNAVATTTGATTTNIYVGYCVGP